VGRRWWSPQYAKRGIACVELVHQTSRGGGCADDDDVDVALLLKQADNQCVML